MNKLNLAFLFDVDGVIAETPHEESWHTASLEWKLIKKEFDFTSFYQKNVAGIPGLKGAENILNLTRYYDIHNIKYPSERKQKAIDFRKLKQKFLNKCIDSGDFRLFKDVISIINGAKKDKIPIAAISASENAEKILKKAEIYNWFDSTTLGAISHKVSKKEDLYLLGFDKLCKKLNLKDPKLPIVFEDADKAISAVKNIDYFCIGIARQGLATIDSLIKNGADIAYDEKILKEKGYKGIRQDLKSTIFPSF